MEIEGLDHVGLNIADLDRSIAWHRDVPGLTRVHQDAEETDMSHVGFRTSRGGLERAKVELRDRGIDYKEGDHGIAWSIYFDDPDGHQIEITTYEAPAG